MCRDTVESMPVTDPSPRTGSKSLKMNHENMNLMLQIYNRGLCIIFAESEFVLSMKQFKIVTNYLGYKFISQTSMEQQELIKEHHTFLFALEIIIPPPLAK
jgi:hypothetical protein